MGTDFYFPELHTNRLLLREIKLEDTAGLFALFSDPQITEFMDIDPLKSESEAADIIEFHFNDSGCRWGLFDHETGTLIGTCGYHRWRKGDINTAEIGYDLAPAYWGQGIMQEALQAIINFGFTEMGLVIIEAEVEPDNGRSINLLKKLGFYADLSRDEALEWFLLFRPSAG